MPASETMEWQIYESNYGAQARADLRHAILCHTLCAAMTGENIDPENFVPNLEPMDADLQAKAFRLAWEITADLSK